MEGGRFRNDFTLHSNALDSIVFLFVLALLSDSIVSHDLRASTNYKICALVPFSPLPCSLHQFTHSTCLVSPPLTRAQTTKGSLVRAALSLLCEAKR